jgi:hypothetical protein
MAGFPRLVLIPSAETQIVTRCQRYNANYGNFLEVRLYYIFNSFYSDAAGSDPPSPPSRRRRFLATLAPAASTIIVAMQIIKLRCEIKSVDLRAGLPEFLETDSKNSHLGA